MTIACDGSSGSTDAVDQEGVGVPVVLQDEQREAGDPGEVGFPLVPDEVGRQLLRRHQIFLDVIEAAAMHLPGGAVDALASCRSRLRRLRSSAMK